LLNRAAKQILPLLSPSSHSFDRVGSMVGQAVIEKDKMVILIVIG